MNTKFLILFITINYLCSCFHVLGQTPSPCDASDSVKQMFQLDADRLALRHMNDNDLDGKDSIRISHKYSRHILQRLIAVYNANYPAVHDTIFDSLNIHTFLDPIVQQISLAADTQLYWVKNLKTGTLPCGNQILDSFIHKYHLDSIDYSAGILGNAYVYFYSDSNLNMKVLADALNQADTSFYASDGGFCCYDDDILVQIGNDYTSVIFTHGWEYCQNGCSYRRYWPFFVYDDCSVEYMGSYGDPLNSVPESIPNLTVHPNPARDHLRVENIILSAQYWIMTNAGEIVDNGIISQQNNIISINNLSPGYFLLKLQNQNGLSIKPFIKVE